MKYESTRGSKKKCSFEDVLIHAYADDGGLFLPEMIPKISQQKLNDWSSLGYISLCKKIVQEYVDIDEYRKLKIDALIEKAFSSFDCEAIIPIKRLGDIFIAELWHGRSLAFKDLAVSCVCCFTEHYFQEKQIHANVICATSGDTGSSVMESAKGCKFIDVFTLFPEGRCSEIQERQMTCITEENIHALCAEGTSDDFDNVIEEVFADEKFASDHRLMSFSSQNWVRIMIQIVHYFYSYFKSVDKIGDILSVVVPSGGLGNLTAGYIAYSMGLPIKLVAAVNQNDSVDRIFRKGDFSQPVKVLKSSSCSMDITVPLNVERILYLACGRDARILTQMMCEFKKNKRVVVQENILRKVREAVQSASIPESRVKETISEVWEMHNYHIEPHTAVAMAVCLHPERFDVKLYGPKIVCLSCASPQKFPEIFKEQDIPFEMSENIKKLMTKKTRFQYLKRSDNWSEILKTQIIAASKKFQNSFE